MVDPDKTVPKATSEAKPESAHAPDRLVAAHVWPPGRGRQAFDPVHRPVKVGRDELQGDPAASRRHLKFRRRGGRLTVEDSGSSNGTEVNGAAIPTGKAWPLNRGDVVRAGDSLLVAHARAPEDIDALRGVFLGCGAEAARIRCQMHEIGRAQGSVYIGGPSGAGKQPVAEGLLEYRPMGGRYFRYTFRRGELAIDELFGRVPGVLGPSDEGTTSVFAMAGKGILHFDEVVEIPAETQTALLPVLDAETRYYRPAGSKGKVPIEARIVSSSDQAPRLLRHQLLARLREFHVEIPPLREHIEDVPELLGKFLNGEVDKLGVEVVQRLLLAPWDVSNVRDLRTIAGRLPTQKWVLKPVDEELMGPARIGRSLGEAPASWTATGAAHPNATGSSEAAPTTTPWAKLSDRALVELIRGALTEPTQLPEDAQLDRAQAELVLQRGSVGAACDAIGVPEGSRRAFANRGYGGGRTRALREAAEVLAAGRLSVTDLRVDEGRRSGRVDGLAPSVGGGPGAWTTGDCACGFFKGQYNQKRQPRPALCRHMVALTLID